MTEFALVRAAYLQLYFDLLREIGISYEGALASSRLPQMIEETPDVYVSIPLALNCVARAGHDLSPMELGYLTSRRVTLDCLDASLQAFLSDATGGLGRIQRYFAMIALEDSSLSTALDREGGFVRLSMDMGPLNSHPHACLAEWQNVAVMIAVIRSAAGPHWSPVEISLAAPYSTPDMALEHYGNTRVRTARPCTSILVEADVLAGPCQDSPVMPEVAQLSDLWTFRTALRSAILPYVAEGRHSLSFASELAGMSPRTLQRRLGLCGTSYSAVVEEARIEHARRMLSDPSLRVGDVAMMCGYENPPHFTRAFHRVTGVTPTMYRRAQQSVQAV